MSLVLFSNPGTKGREEDGGLTVSTKGYTGTHDTEDQGPLTIIFFFFEERSTVRRGIDNQNHMY